MLDIGEQIVGTWLKEIKGCEFVEYGVKTTGQGEIDVVGLCLKEKHAYLCEVATHVQGLWYADSTGDTVKKLLDKFRRAADWAESHLNKVQCTYMLWTPALTRPKSKSKLDSFGAVEQVKAELKQKDRDFEVVTNEGYQEALESLRERASKITSNPSSPVLRLMQIEESNKRMTSRLRRAE